MKKHAKTEARASGYRIDSPLGIEELDDVETWFPNEPNITTGVVYLRDGYHVLFGRLEITGDGSVASVTAPAKYGGETVAVRPDQVHRWFPHRTLPDGRRVGFQSVPGRPMKVSIEMIRKAGYDEVLRLKEFVCSGSGTMEDPWDLDWKKIFRGWDTEKEYALFLENGVYGVFSSGRTFKLKHGDVDVIGESWDTVITFADDVEGHRGLTGCENDNTRWFNLCFDGKRDRLQKKYLANARRCKHGSYDTCCFRNVNLSGLQVGDDVEDFFVENCRFERCKYGIWLNSSERIHRFVLRDSVFFSPDNYVTLQYDHHSDHTKDDMTELLVEDCIMTEYGQFSVALASMNDVIVRRCTILGEEGDAAVGQAVHLEAKCRDVDIVECDITNPKGHLINVAASKDVVLADNYIHDGPTELAEFRGISQYVKACPQDVPEDYHRAYKSRYRILRNLFENGGTGLNISRGACVVKVQSNIFKDIKQIGIKFQSEDCDEISIQNNKFHGAEENIMVLRGSATPTKIEKNDFSDCRGPLLITTGETANVSLRENAFPSSLKKAVKIKSKGGGVCNLDSDVDEKLIGRH